MPSTTKASMTYKTKDQQQADTSKNSTTSGSKNGKVMITGDDILIEYVSRLSNNLKNIHEDSLEGSQRQRMEKFISHYVWHMPD